jgi:hypothetical protein
MYMALMMLGRQMRTAEPLVPEPSSFEAEIATKKLKIYKSPGTYQILAELLKAGRKYLML